MPHTPPHHQPTGPTGPESNPGTSPPAPHPAPADAPPGEEECAFLLRHAEECLGEIRREAASGGAAGPVSAALVPLERAAALLGERARAGRPLDLESCRRLLEALVPAEIPEVRGLALAVRVEPSEVVGGNVCLILPVNEANLFVAVLDASGQGLPVACLSIWSAFELARAACVRSHSPRRLLNHLNRRLLARPGGRYLRAFAADIDLDLMEMRYVNASHCEPLWLRHGRIESLDTQGLFVGLFEDAEYEEKALQLSEGEGLLFYSDPVVDALRSRAGLVEPAGLLSLVEENLRAEAGELVDLIVGEVRSARAEPHDDVVVLAMRCRHIETWHSVVIPSTFDESKRIADAVLEHLTLERFSERAVFATKLALEEALANAIKHGNKGDPSKRVEVKYSICPDRVVIIVTDEGEGFNPSTVPDPTAEERLELPSGRGILLMRAYMTSVEYNERGNQVKLVRTND